MTAMNPGARPLVLVVEDEPLLRMMAVDLVEDAGCDAVDAVDADQAIHILERQPEIRVVFTDIDLPGTVDGMWLARAVRDRWPPIEIILTSGHLRPAESELPARSVFYPKPYPHERLVETLREFAGA